MDTNLFVPFNLLLMLILIISFVLGDFSGIEEISQRLDDILVGVEGPKKFIDDSAWSGEFWQPYEFGTGVGNREELTIKNITIKIDSQLLDNIENYQFIEANEEFFLAGSSHNVFYFYKFDWSSKRTVGRIEVNATKKIENFKIFFMPNTSRTETEEAMTILAIICVKSLRGTDMLWYRYDGDELVYLDSWSVKDRVESLQFFHHSGQNRLLILREDTMSFGQILSPIDIYGLSIEGEKLNWWLTRKSNVPKIFDIHVCPSYETTMLALRRNDHVAIYEYEFDESGEDHFIASHNVTSNNVKNVLCFESGHIRYIVTSGPEAALFDFFESEFQHDSYSEHVFNEFGETSWIRSIPIDNYRHESLLMVQLRNSSVVILAWKGRGFERISLPNRELENYDLKSITVIPKYGFVRGNRLVEIETGLVEKTRPVRDEVENLLRRRYALADIMAKQELILRETESRLNKSYLVNPRVTGNWNISSIEVKSLTIGKTTRPERFLLGTRDTDLEDYLSNHIETRDKINDLQSRIYEIRDNLEKSVPIDAPEIIIDADLIIDGNLDVLGTMSANNLTFERLNGFSRDDIIRDFSNYNDELPIEGEKTFESIDADSLNVIYINGLPIEDIQFDRTRRDYANVNFSKFTKLKIEGNLNFTTLNGVDWEKLIGRVVLKSESSTISGITIIEGDLIANNIEIDSLNSEPYPEGYIMSKDRDPVMLAGEKRFDNLILGHLDIDSIETINGLSIDQYVTLNGERILEEEAIFENLKITENLRIDGEVSGLPEDYMASRLTLKETSNVIGNVLIENLTVIGNLRVENTFNGMNWSRLDDLVTIDEKEVEIVGSKLFLGKVEVDKKLEIDKRTINGHSIDDFVTLDTDQELPNLRKISGNVSFDHMTRHDFEEMRRKLSGDSKKFQKTSPCLSKILVFKIAPVVNRLFFKVLNDNVTSLEFMAATNRSFANVRFRHLKVSNLRGGEYKTSRVNGANYADVSRARISRTQPQMITGNYEIDELKTNFLRARKIDGSSPTELENLRINLDNFYDRITNGSEHVRRLTIEGDLAASKINGQALENLYDPDRMGKVTFFGDLDVDHLILDGNLNGMSFTSLVQDSVMKNDPDIIVTGEKRFGKVICESLQATRINGKSVENILDPEKHQILSGTIRVRGVVKVLDRFETDGKIGNLSWPELRTRSRRHENGTYTLIGNVTFVDEASMVENLFVTDSVQGHEAADFPGSFVFKNNSNLTIHGPIVFRDPITIDSALTITETFNDLDLKHFYEHAVLVDRPLNVKSRKIRFARSVRIERDLLVDKELEAKKIGGTDLKELYDNALFVDRPTSITGSVTVDNAVFESDVRAEQLNDIDLRSVITLGGEQTFDDSLQTRNITVGKLEVLGTINSLNLNTLYENTLLLTGNQNVSRPIIFAGSVRIRNNFDAAQINDIDPSKMISLDGNDTLIGNFIFVRPIVFHGNLKTRGLVNGVDLRKWEAAVVTKSFPIRQLVKGAWTVRGNVYFEKNVYGSDLFDGINVTEFANDLYRRDMEMELKMANIQGDLSSFCEDLKILKNAAENQIYRYEFFQYLQVMNFDDRILSFHHYELEDFDYLLINFESCHLDIFVFTGDEFTRVTSLPNVGRIERWYQLRYEGDLYFLTVGKNACGRNRGNLWKIKNDQFIHVLDLGNVTDARKIKDDEFLTIVDGKIVRRTIAEIYQRSLSLPYSLTIGDEDWKFVVDSRELLLANSETIIEMDLENVTESKRITNGFGTGDIYSFHLGIYRREVFIYYDPRISEEYLFVSDNNFRHHKIHQTIKSQNPSSVVLLGLDGLVENLLIFIEDQRSLQIYEYRGIEGFVYRENIRISAEKIFGFRFRRYSRLARKHCLAVVQGKRLVLIEAKMQGEKLDMGSLSCD